ncbi:MAG TPA: 16S rRNA (guanine(966)-N(2))-methyltransferase RsmD [Gammaproteobacteria bacterium]|nr:16S rRNA (guanine(966)-N(2))-methyltransferase RsmD [Gammaproteobacteria bacterium]
MKRGTRRAGARPAGGSSARAGGLGSVRIVGGRWRGRRLPVPAAEVRPSADRVRETLFNWLAPRLPGARCLDLFAGTGVLGFEALSRGARAVSFVERDPAVVAHLHEMRARLEAEAAEILRYDALAWLAATPPMPYDVVFVDPPFGTDLAPKVLAALSAGWLADGGVVYVEAPVAPALPPGWERLREGRTRQVVYALVAPHSADTHRTSGEI